MIRYFIAHNKMDIFHYSRLIPGQVVATGQPYLEFFDVEVEFENRLHALSPTAYNEYLNLKMQEWV